MSDEPPTPPHPRISSRSEEARLRVVIALERLERSERDALDELQHALCGYVAALRDDGHSAEGATSAVAHLVSEVPARGTSLFTVPAIRTALVDLATGWCLGEYERLEKLDGVAKGSADHGASREVSPPPPPA